MGDDMSSPAADPRRVQTSIVKVGREAWTQSFAVSHKVRLVHILKNLHTSEVKIYSDASREFIQLLDGESGGQVLQEFVQQSPRLVELVEAWRMHREKPGVAYILSLFATILGHRDGKLRRHGLVKKNLDAVARMILEDKEKWGDVLLELNSGDSRRQNAALDLTAAIVRRGGGLAAEIAERFDFKMATLPQLAGSLKKKRAVRDGGNHRSVAEFGSTRRSFIGFAMSFLEVGNPRLLRWVLQQKEVYSAVLRGIRNDDAETIVYVLSTLRDNVLVEESLVPPGLRSVLFGSATLEQLSLISGNLDAGVAADVAHEVLVMVCTDPKNGLMPGMNLRGNEKRLLDLMKKLKATEVAHHKSLLLAIVSKRLSLCLAYMNEFPYSIEPRSSSSWLVRLSNYMHFYLNYRMLWSF
jgi:nucleolar pre-ribosomal-associated protein 1